MIQNVVMSSLGKVVKTIASRKGAKNAKKKLIE